MIIYIPQNIDPYNTHLKNLVKAYTSKGVDVIVGYKNFIVQSVIPDVIHFHHIEGLISNLNFDEKLFFNRMDFFQNKRVKFIYSAHNISPHSTNSKINHSSFINRFFNYVSIVIHHGKSSIGILLQSFPNLAEKKHIVCHHGDYLAEMKNFNETMMSARKILKLPYNKKIVLVFGQLQHKNPNFIKEVFDKAERKEKQYILLMAGVNPIFKFNRINQIYYKINNLFFNPFRKNKILIHKRFSQFETYLLFVASDVIFLSHKSGLTSGIIPLSATLGKPFVYPNIGVFANQAEYCFAEKYENGNITGAFDAIEKILNSEIKSFDNSKWLENNNWNIHVDRILSTL